MDRPIERILFDSGDWWEIYTEVTRGMRRKFREAAMKALTGKLDLNGHTNLSDPDQIKAAILSQPQLVNLNAVDDGYLLHGTKAWSFPQPFSLEAVDELPDAIVEKVLERMRLLYSEPGEEAQKKDIGKF